MFNRDAISGKNNESAKSEPHLVDVTPRLGAAPAVRPHTSSTAQRETSASGLDTGAREKKSTSDQEPVGSRLVVGPDIKLKGVEITDCDTLIVEGRVEASMDSRVVQVAERGVFSGTATMDVAEICGRFEGELTARKQLVIHATGRVSGHIRYGSIRIEEGGELSGDVSTIGMETGNSVQPENTATGTLSGTTYESSAAAKKGKVSLSTT